MDSGVGYEFGRAIRNLSRLRLLSKRFLQSESSATAKRLIDEFSDQNPQSLGGLYDCVGIDLLAYRQAK